MTKEKNVAILDDKSFWENISKNTNKIVNQKWKTKSKSRSAKKN